MDIKPICIGCNKRPNEIQEYIELAEECHLTPDEFVESEEGTYNPVNGHFTCTNCYFEMGMPSNHYPEGNWVAP